MREGQRVICINDDFSNTDQRLAGKVRLPKFGVTYTIRHSCGCGLLLEEIVNESLPTFLPWILQEPHFDHNRFVPIVDDEVEIEEMEIAEVEV